MCHLRTCCRQQHLLWASARHCARAQVGNETPQTKDCRSTRLDCVDVSKASKTLGNLLHKCACNCCWRRGTSLTSRQQQHWHSAVHRNFEALTCIACKLQWWNDETVGLADEWSCAPLVFAACNFVQHLQRCFEVIWVHPRSTNVFCGAAHAQVTRIDVHG